MNRSPYTPNSSLVSFFGLCPLIGTSASFATGSTMAVAVALGVFLMGLFAPLFNRALPSRLVMASLVAFSAFYALFVGILVGAYSPLVYADLGFYIPLIMVNCLLIHEMRKNLSKDSPNLRATLSSSLSFLAIALALSLLREGLGTGGLSLPNPGIRLLAIPLFDAPPIPMLQQPSGGFMAIGLFAFAHRLGSRVLGRSAA